MPDRAAQITAVQSSIQRLEWAIGRARQRAIDVTIEEQELATLRELLRQMKAAGDE